MPATSKPSGALSQKPRASRGSRRPVVRERRLGFHTSDRTRRRASRAVSSSPLNHLRHLHRARPRLTFSPSSVLYAARISPPVGLHPRLYPDRMPRAKRAYDLPFPRITIENRTFAGEHSFFLSSDTVPTAVAIFAAINSQASAPSDGVSSASTPPVRALDA